MSGLLSFLSRRGENHEATSPPEAKGMPIVATLRAIIPQCELIQDDDHKIDKTELLSIAKTSDFLKILTDHILKIQRQTNEYRENFIDHRSVEDLLQAFVDTHHALCAESERNFVAELIIDLIMKQSGEQPTSKILNDIPLYIWNKITSNYEYLGINAQVVLSKSEVGKQAAVIIEGPGTGLLLYYSQSAKSFAVDRYWHGWPSIHRNNIGSYDIGDPTTRQLINVTLNEVIALDPRRINLFIMLLRAVHNRKLDLDNLLHT